MGIPLFFAVLRKKYPGVVVKYHFKKCPSFDNVYLDCNGLIHPVVASVENPTIENVSQAFFKKIEEIVNTLKPKKLLFLSFDGVAPCCKMKQQRLRRFRSVYWKKMNFELENMYRKMIEDWGYELPSKITKDIDTNCISPGTKFMHGIALEVREWVKLKLSKNDVTKDWKHLKVIISDATVPGEGEQKIIHFIRDIRIQENYLPNTTHVLVGLDADFIPLSLALHEPHCYIYRGQCQNSKTSHEFLSIYALRQYLGKEFYDPNLSFSLEMERVFDDFVLITIFFGNDFLPSLPLLSIQRSKTFRTVFIEAYRQFLWKCEGNYLINREIINWKSVKLYLEILSVFESHIYNEMHKSALYGGKRSDKGEKVSQVHPNGTSGAENEEEVEKSKTTRIKEIEDNIVIEKEKSAKNEEEIEGEGEIKEKEEEEEEEEEMIYEDNRIKMKKFDKKVNLSINEILEYCIDEFNSEKDVIFKNLPGKLSASELHDFLISKLGKNSVTKLDIISKRGGKRGFSGGKRAFVRLRDAGDVENCVLLLNKKIFEIQGNNVTIFCEPVTIVFGNNLTILGENCFIESRYNVYNHVGLDRKKIRGAKFFGGGIQLEMESKEAAESAMKIYNELVKDKKDEEIEYVLKSPNYVNMSLYESKFTRLQNLLENVVMNNNLERDSSRYEKWIFSKKENFKNDYYISKFGKDEDEGEKIPKLADLITNYCCCLDWILHYYFRNDCKNWRKCYPWEYAPFASDLAFSGIELKDYELMERDQPFSPFQQLLLVLPKESLHVVPKSYENLILSDSELTKYYDISCLKIDYMGPMGEKLYTEFMGIPRIAPLLPLERVLEKLSRSNPEVSEEDLKRNKIEKNILCFLDPKKDELVFKRFSIKDRKESYNSKLNKGILKSEIFPFNRSVKVVFPTL